MALSLDGTTGISATGNIYGNNIIVTNSLTAGIFSPATMVVAGNVTGGNILTAGLISATGNITGGNILGGANVNATTHTGTTVSVSANVTGGNVLTAGLISAAGNITGGNILGGANVNATTHTGTTVSVSANITGGNILTAGLISATGTITGSSFSGAGTGLTGTASSLTVGAATSATTATTATTATSATTAGTVTTAAQGNITSVGTLTGVTVSGTITINSGAAATAIINGATTGVGNIGSSTVYFNTGFLKATTAQYADLAEMYAADADYAPGTVLDFGGPYEVTLSSVPSSSRVAGIVSTDPAHLMNSMLEAEYTVPMALAGRVPTSVVGTVRKGDMMVSDGNGSAQSCAAPTMGTVIGKALENFDGVSGVIEIVVGRL